MNSTELTDAVRDRFSEAVSASHTFRDDTTLVLKGDSSCSRSRGFSRRIRRCG